MNPAFKQIIKLPVVEITNLERLRVSKKANTEQRKWMDDITEYVNENGLGELYGHDYDGHTNIQRHHVLGRTARHNKIDIGHWFIIPVPFELHDPNVSHKYHVHKCKNAFVRRFGNQRDIYEHLATLMECQGYAVPPHVNHYAIMGTTA